MGSLLFGEFQGAWTQISVGILGENTPMAALLHWHDPLKERPQSGAKRGKIFCFENLNFYSWNDYFKHREYGMGWLVCSQFVVPWFSKLGGFPNSLVHPSHPWQNILKGFPRFWLIMNISSFFSDCLGAAPTFDVDFNIYCSLALGRRFANPQFEEEGKTKLGCWGFDILEFL